MKSVISTLVLVMMVISVNAFAGNKTVRKPASGTTCGTAAHAVRLAITQAEEDTNSKKCTSSGEATEGPAGSFFTTYHVSLTCDGKQVNYDAESHSIAMPENMLTCESTVAPAGAMTAHTN